MSKKVINTKDISNHIQTLINNIITTEESELQFVITDDTQHYDKYVKLNKKNYIPGIVTSISPIIPGSKIGLYSGVYRLNIYGYEDKKDEITNIINGMLSSNGEMFLINEMECSGYYGVLRYLGKVESRDGDNIERFIANIDFTIITSINADLIMGDSVKLYLDDKEVYYTDILFSNTKGTMNLALKDIDTADENFRLNSEVLTLTFPYLKVPEETNEVEGELVTSLVDDENGSLTIHKIFKNIMEQTYNIKLKIKIEFPQYTYESDYVLKTGSIITSNIGAPIAFSAGFENTSYRTEVSIDNVRVPIISYSYSKGMSVDNTFDPDTLISGSYGIGMTNGFILNILHDNSPMTTSLLKEIRGNNMNIPHVIKIKSKGINYPSETPLEERIDEYIENEYRCITLTGSEITTEDPDITFNMTFGLITHLEDQLLIGGN